MPKVRRWASGRRRRSAGGVPSFAVVVALILVCGTAVPALAQSTTAPLRPTPVYPQTPQVSPALSDGEAIRQTLEHERDGLLRPLPSGRSIVITGSGSDGQGPCRSFMVMDPAGFAETAVACRDAQARWMLVEIGTAGGPPATPAPTPGPATQGTGFAVPPLAVSLPAPQPAPGHGLAMPEISPEAAAIAASVGLLAILAATGAEIGYCPP